MAVKKPARRVSSKKKEEVELTNLPDVFDEDAGAKGRSPVVVESVEETPEIPEPAKEDVKELEVEPQVLRAPKAPRVVTEVEEDEPAPIVVSPPVEPVAQVQGDEAGFKVRQNGQEVEQQLPSFFVSDSQVDSDKVSPAAPEVSSPDSQILETAVPQAFVGEVREVAREVKRERKGRMVTIFIILGMVLVSAGAIGLFLVNTRKQNGLTSPVPTGVVEATPEPTPMVEVETATSSATASVSAELKKEYKVNVLNGTTIKGLASKEAAVLRQNDFVLGTVGNGDPAKAGTIVVPEGRLDFGDEIKTLLSDFDFTVTEDTTQKAITVTLGEPKN